MGHCQLKARDFDLAPFCVSGVLGGDADARQARYIGGMLQAAPPVTVRRARREDAAALLKIFRDSWRLAYTGVIPPHALEHELRARDLRWWQRAAAHDTGLIVLTFGANIAGYATCGAARGGPKTSGEIYELYLAPVYQGVGLGELLFEACRSKIDNAGLPNMVVWSLAGNEAALEFYRRRGGRPSKRSCIRVGGAVLDRIAFGW